MLSNGGEGVVICQNLLFPSKFKSMQAS